jgi:hypothetical protein
MWWAIGIIGGALFTQWVLVLILLARIRGAEDFVMILSSVVIGQATQEMMAEYVKSRTHHPAGKKRGGTRHVGHTPNGGSKNAQSRESGTEEPTETE